MNARERIFSGSKASPSCPDDNDVDSDEAEEKEDDFEAEDGGGPCGCGSARIFAASCCGGCCLLVLIVLAVLAYVAWTLVGLKYQKGNEQDPNIEPPNFPRQMGCGGCSPGEKTNAEIERCARPCFGVEYVLAWESLAKRLGYALVRFPSRPGPRGEPPVNLTAWWLPPDPRLGVLPSAAPRIVALHGLGSNNNHCGVQSTCFLLRSMGFGCLTPSVRDYGLSGPSTHPDILTWGYDYQLDLLGAWDYAVNDPDGVLGGALPAEKVGVMGFSKGGLATAIGFAQERRIPGAWLDSAPYCGLRGMIMYTVEPFLGPLAGLMGNIVWFFANRYFGGRLDLYRPLELLANCTGPPRHVAVSQGTFDSVVPLAQGNAAINLMSGLTACYALTAYTPPEYCDGSTHHQEMWEFPDSMRSELCEFWSATFQQSRDLCGLADLPRLQEWHAPDHLPPRSPLVAG